jgi:hypothetical protein
MGTNASQELTAYILISTLKMKVVCYSETLVTTDQTTSYRNPE